MTNDHWPYIASDPPSDKLILLEDVPLAPLNTWKIGGHAQRLVCPHSIEQLSHFLQLHHPIPPPTWLGLGSNVLVPDEGLTGLVIHSKALNQIQILEGARVWVQAGVPCPKLARFCSKHQLTGQEFFVGIPGTIGGALTMNAGAFGGETWQAVEKVFTLDKMGKIVAFPKSSFHVGYRHVEGPEHYGFVGAVFQFSPGTNEASEILMKSLLKKRQGTQPIGTFNCGSVFKNPQSHFAAQLIEASGLKGYAVGNARVSLKHANFIINEGGALAAHVTQLMQIITQRVFEDTHVHLTPEVRILA